MGGRSIRDKYGEELITYCLMATHDGGISKEVGDTWYLFIQWGIFWGDNPQKVTKRDSLCSSAQFRGPATGEVPSSDRTYIKAASEDKGK